MSADPVTNATALLRQLSNVCQMYRCTEPSGKDGDHIDLTKNFRRFLDSEDVEKLLQHLGVCIAGFVYLNEEAQRADYGFFGPATGDHHKSYMVPYQRSGWPQVEQLPADDYLRDLEDRPCTLVRSNDTDGATKWCHDTLNLNEAKGAEIAREAGKGDLQPLRDAIQFNRCERAVDGLFYLHRHHQNPFKCQGHEFPEPEYLRDLPLNETSARLGLRRTSDPKDKEKQLRDSFGIHIVPYGELTAFMFMWRRLLRRLTAAARQPWTRVDWTNVATFECDLARIVCDYKTATVGTLPIQTLRCINWLVDRIEGPSWTDDLYSLLLLDTHNDSLASLRRFVQGLDDPPDWPDTVSAVTLEQLADELLACSGICALSPECNSVREIRDAIIQLHDASRFPILPYYYWNALSRRRRTHAVIPIFGRVTRPLQCERYPTHGIAGVAVVDIEPLKYFDFTIAPKDGTDRKMDQPEDEWRLDTLKHFLELVAAPQIDSLYYAEEKKREAAFATAEGQERLARNIHWRNAHECQNLLSLIRDGTSEFVLDAVRAWFTVLFGTNRLETPSKWSDYFPDSFGKGHTLFELVRSSMRIAGQLRYIEKTLTQHSELAMNHSGLAAEDRLRPAGDEVYLALSELRCTTGAKAFGAFTAALVCMLSNVLKNTDTPSNAESPVPIEVLVKRDRLGRPAFVLFRNDGSAAQPSAVSKLYSTAEACKAWVEAWGGDRRSVAIDYTNGKWESTLPIPDELVVTTGLTKVGRGCNVDND